MVSDQGLREALEKLVALKDGPRDDTYRAEKDATWQAARDALAAEPVPDRRPSDAAVEAALIEDQPSWHKMPEDVRSDLRLRTREMLEAAYRVDAPRTEVVVDHRPGETCHVATSVDPATGWPRPLLDREAVTRIINEARALPATWPSTPSTDAVMELARPMPTQAELTDWLRDIFVTDADPEGTTWDTAAELLLALLNGAEQ